MKIVLVNVNSFGGNYSYSLALAKAYSNDIRVESCTLVVPENALKEDISNKVSWELLGCNDQPSIENKWFRKIHYIYRAIVGPIKIWWYLLNLPKSIVIFNDYEQFSAPFWVPLYLILKTKHSFGIILHDPDRDAYMKWRPLSVWTMKCVMSLPQVAFYHEYLPNKSYYHKSIPFISIPHGIYHNESFDVNLYNQLFNWKGDQILWCIPGNIRDEKNYLMIIQALKNHPESKLLIAGKPSSSKVDVELYKTESKKVGVENQILWVEKFLTEAELQSVVKVSDLILLYYKESFVSQSGILNLIAPHKKKVLTSKINSALSHTVAKNDIGLCVGLDASELEYALRVLEKEDSTLRHKNWDNYMKEHSWDSHVKLVLDSFINLGKR